MVGFLPSLELKDCTSDPWCQFVETFRLSPLLGCLPYRLGGVGSASAPMSHENNLEFRLLPLLGRLRPYRLGGELLPSALSPMRRMMTHAKYRPLAAGTALLALSVGGSFTEL